jgi:serine/threonine protein kinase
MDNVRHKTGITSNIFTPFYGAPEIVSFRSSNTPMSDSFSFAVIAFELLTLSHPLIGDYVSDGEPELEEKALNGELPWIEDARDKINSSSTGFASSVFITPLLNKLFHRIFEDGLNDPDKRPDMYEWYDALCKSTNNLLKCPSCKIFYPYDTKHKCTICDQEPKKISQVSMRCWNEMGNSEYGLYEKVWEEILLDDNTPKVLTAEHFLCSKTEVPEKLLELKMIEVKDGKSQICITPLNNNEFYLYRQSGEPFERLPRFSTPIKVSINPDVPRANKLMLATKELGNGFQRVMTID